MRSEEGKLGEVYAMDLTPQQLWDCGFRVAPVRVVTRMGSVELN